MVSCSMWARSHELVCGAVETYGRQGVTTIGAAPETCSADKRRQYSSIVQVAGGYFTPIATDSNGWMGLHASHLLTLPPVLPG
jgi:hypothetical protein